MNEKNGYSSWVWFFAILLMVATLFVYACINELGFISFDDPAYVINNNAIQQGVTSESIAWAFTSSHSNNWHPLTWISHMLDWKLFNTDPAGHHRTSLIFHVINTLLLFVLLKKMTGFTRRSAVVAAFFALHPLHVESVAWISERKDVLSAFFWILASFAYLRYVKSKSKAAYIGVVVLFALGLMSKPMVITLPFVLLLLDYWPLNRINHAGSTTGEFVRLNKGLVIEKIPLFLLTIASSLVTFFVQQQSGAVRSFEQFSLGARLANTPVAYVEYLKKTFVPTNLSVFYPHPGDDFSMAWVIGSIVILIAITVAVFVFRRRYPYLIMGWLWYVGTLVPVIGLVQVGLQSMADRYTYIPLIGIFIMIVWLATELLPYKNKGTVHFVAGISVILIYLFMCSSQVKVWKDDKTLFTRAIQNTSNNYVAHTSLGNYYLLHKQPAEAVPHFAKAVQYCPENYEHHLNLGRALVSTKKHGEAEPVLRKAVELAPEDGQARAYLALSLLNQRKSLEAEEHLVKAVELAPHLYVAQFNLGILRMNQGRYKDAIPYLEVALQINPNSSAARKALSDARIR